MLFGQIPTKSDKGLGTWIYNLFFDELLNLC